MTGEPATGFGSVLRGLRLSAGLSQEALARRAALACPGFVTGPDNADAVARVCELLDGIPLAIELAAARQAGDRANRRPLPGRRRPCAGGRMSGEP